MPIEPATSTHTVHVNLRPDGEKKHSRIFVDDGVLENPVIKTVYLSRPQANGHTKARITVEFLD